MDNDNFEGTIILKATEETLDLITSATMTKEQVMQILIEALHAIDSMDIDMDEVIPQGAFGAGMIQ